MCLMFQTGYPPALIVHVTKVLVSYLTCKRNAEIVLEAVNLIFKWWPSGDLNWLGLFVSCKSSTLPGLTLVIERENYSKNLDPYMFWFDNNLPQYCRRCNSHVSSNTRNVRSWNIIIPSIQILVGDSFPWLNSLSIMESSIMILRTNSLRSNDPIWHHRYQKKTCSVESEGPSRPYSFLTLIFPFKKSWRWIFGLDSFMFTRIQKLVLNFVLRDIHHQKNVSDKIPFLPFLPLYNCGWARFESVSAIKLEKQSYNYFMKQRVNTNLHCVIVTFSFNF